MAKIDEMRQMAELIKKATGVTFPLNLCDALKEAMDYLEERRRWYEIMGKHQQYDFRDKLAKINAILEKGKDGTN